MERRQIRLGLVGYGEVGSGLGFGLREEGLKSVLSYDIAAFDGVFSELIQSRAKKAGVELVRSPQDLAKAADVIIAVVPGSECVVAAEAIAPYLDAHHLYVDIGSATPSVKRRVGDVSHTVWSVYLHPGETPPRGLRSLQKLVHISE